jgi:hypothetical protein
MTALELEKKLCYEIYHPINNECYFDSALEYDELYRTSGAAHLFGVTETYASCLRYLQLRGTEGLLAQMEFEYHQCENRLKPYDKVPDTELTLDFDYNRFSGAKTAYENCLSWIREIAPSPPLAESQRRIFEERQAFLQGAGGRA